MPDSVASANASIRTFLVSRLATLIERYAALASVLLPTTLISLGVVYSFLLGPTPHYPDEREYYSLATNLAFRHAFSRDGTHPTAYRPPGYPWIITLPVLAGADIVVLRILNFIALGLTMFVLYRTVASHASRPAAAIAALLMLSYPALFYLAGTLYPQTTAALLFQIVIFLLLWPRGLWPFVASGFLFGLLLLTVPAFVSALPVFAVWFAVTGGKPAARRFAITILLCLTVVALWTTRNYLVFGRFVAVTSHSGMNLLIGNSSDSDPRAWWKVDISRFESQVRGLDEVDRDAYYARQALRFVLEHKVEALRLYLWKFAYHFHFRNDFATEVPQSWLRHTRDITMLVSYGVLLILFLMRAVQWRRASAFELLLVSLYLAGGLGYAVFHPRIRFRLPWDPVLIAVAAIYLARALEGRAPTADSAMCGVPLAPRSSSMHS